MAGALTAAIAAAFSGGAAVVTDPYFEYTTLLLPGNGTNGAQNNTFLDGSTNNFTITRNGNTTQGTFSPFSQTGWGNYFDGTGDSLTAPSGACISGTGDFTAECWVFPTVVPGAYNILACSDSSNGLTMFGLNANGTIFYGRSLVNIQGTTSNSVSYNTWNHVAISRSSSTLKMFINGVQGFSGTETYSYASGTVRLGTDGGGSAAPYTGYISNFRIIQGSALYTSNFTPPTSPLTAISGTSLLTCQSNRFRDASSNNFTITRNGDTSVVAFSPFNPTASWSAATYGGSGYFDGSGDYLNYTQTGGVGNGDFTLELWLYPIQIGDAIRNVWDCRSVEGGTDGFWLGSDTTNFYMYYATSKVISTSYPTVNAWTHVALVRSGNDHKLYFNGTQVGSTYTAANNYSNTSIFISRYFGSATYYTNGYFSSLRLVKGTAVYTSNFTPPTAPLTAITNTSLLLNFTNAGIYDATSKNDLETVGNAQISTTQSKWGGSSISFDGTGDYLLPNVATSDMYAFGTGDFTIEFWVRYNSGLNVDVALYDSRPTSTNGVYPLLFSNPTGKMVYYVSSAARITGTTTLVAGNWYHVALARSGTSTKLFINGSQEGSTYTDSNNYIVGTNRPAIGAAGIGLGADPLNGYIQDLRVTKGIARYTTNFTAPTAAFPTL